MNAAPSGKNIKALCLKIAVAIFLLALLSLKVRWREACSYLFSIPPADFIFCFFLSLAAVVLGACRWKVLLPDYPFRLLLKFNFVGQYYSALFSGQLGGEAVKTYWLGKTRGDTGRVAASVFMDKAAGFLALIFMAFAGVCFSSRPVSRVIFLDLSLLIFALILFLVLSQTDFFYGRILGVAALLKKRASWLVKFLDFIESFLKHWKGYSGKIGDLLKVFALGILYQCLGMWVACVLSRGLGLEVTFWDWCWMTAVLAGALLLPVTVAGFGVREATLVCLLGLFGVIPEKALAISFSFFLIQFLTAFVGGVLQARDAGRAFR